MVREGREQDCNMETSPGDVGAKLRGVSGLCRGGRSSLCINFTVDCVRSRGRRRAAGRELRARGQGGRDHCGAGAGADSGGGGQTHSRYRADTAVHFYTFTFFTLKKMIESIIRIENL